MATAKYFLVTNRETAKESLIRASKEAQAISVVAGGAASVRLATDDDIAEFQGKLHQRSIDPGSGRYFVVDGQIIRAKNAASAFTLVNQDLFEAKLLNQDELVAQLQKGLDPIHYEEPAKQGKGASAQDSAGSSDDTGTQAAATTGASGPSVNASNDDAGQTEETTSAVAAAG